MMEDTKRIRITDFGQTRILGLTAQSFEELQMKGKARFKDHNTFMIRMKTSKPIFEKTMYALASDDTSRQEHHYTVIFY